MFENVKMIQAIRTLTGRARSSVFVVALIGALALAIATPAVAQTVISQPIGTEFETRDGMGQSFLATQTGVITKIRVRPLANSSTTMYVWAEPVMYPPDISGKTAYAQAVTLVDGGSVTTGFQEITLDTPFPIVAGQTYAFGFDQSALARWRGPPQAYTDGYYLRDLRFTNFISSLVFEVVQEAPAPVPTMSEWAMILLGLMLAGGAVIAVQRRGMTA